MYQLRPYQHEAVQATLKHFRQDKSPAVIVLPTGAGKSLVIAELARLARGRVLVLAHVRELVEQNHQKYVSFGLDAGIYSAGLDRKDAHQKVIFGSIQSVARATEDFFKDFSLVVIDECHRVSMSGKDSNANSNVNSDRNGKRYNHSDSNSNSNSNDNNNNNSKSKDNNNSNVSSTSNGSSNSNSHSHSHSNSTRTSDSKITGNKPPAATDLPSEGATQYFQVISKLQKENPEICILGLTATPYRLGMGWIYNYNTHTKTQQTTEHRFFKKCIYELTIRYMIKNGYLTPPIKIDSPVACYDFSSLKLQGTHFQTAQIEALLKDQKRITPLIIKNIIDMSKERHGVMIFTSSVNHAIEIMQSLPPYISALVVGDTESKEREEVIDAFKKRELKFLVNVSVLTTGFDAPHVDVIAILRPTESVSLYQQIVGRGLRLSPGKEDCLILDYTGQDHDLYSPEIDDDKPSQESVMVEVPCPKCGITNHFWGLTDEDGEVIEHFGRKCKAAFEDPQTKQLTPCDFRFRFKLCPECGEENDIAARVCHACTHLLVDTDKKLKEAMSLKDAHVLRVDSVVYQKGYDKKGNERLEVKYYDVDAKFLTEYFYINSKEDAHAFYFNFIRMHNRRPERKLFVKNVDEAIAQKEKFRAPMFVVARKQKYFWNIREKIFE